MIKPGVDLRGLQPQMVLAYVIAAACYAEEGVPCVITSGSDGVHLPNSLHYQGKALDLRTHTLRAERIHVVFLAVQQALGAQFDCVLEEDHLHVEWQPHEAAKMPEQS